MSSITSSGDARFTVTGETPDCQHRSTLWDSGLGTPTPGSPQPRNNRPSSSMLSPIPFNCEFVETDEEDQGLEMKIPLVPATPITPPHKKFRSLRLYDTPHTPKSLLQKSQRRIAGGTKRYGDKDSVKLVLDPDGPQANVNPFTSCTSDATQGQGVKRGRSDIDRFVQFTSVC